jgi:hypothetical protein
MFSTPAEQAVWYLRKESKNLMRVLNRSTVLCPDMLLIVFLSCLMGLLGAYRLDYAGDGLRHLAPIFSSSLPTLGEPRWVLFPALLFCVIKPFVLLGLIDTTAQAAQAFAIFNAVCGGLYLLCLRKWMLDMVPARRTIILFLVASTFTFLSLATDTLEATAAALIAIAGLTWARFYPTLTDRGRLTVAVAAIALASLVYQGLLFALFLLPATLPRTVYASRPGLIRIATITALVPLTVIGLLTLAGDSPTNAARRFTQGEANPLASSTYSQRSIKDLVGVAIVGPSYALNSIPGLRGLSGSLAMLREQATAIDALVGVLPWLIGAAALAATLVLLVLRRHHAVLVAYGGMMALPMIRMSQYAYVKYYALLPLLIVLAVVRLVPRSGHLALIGLLFFASNLSQYVADRTASQAFRTRIIGELLPQLPRDACFLTDGWGPSVPNWRGPSLSWLHILEGGNARNFDDLVAANATLLRNGLKQIFCGCKVVVTDAFTKPNLKALTQQLQNFGLSSVSISELVVEAPERSRIFTAANVSVYRFSDQERERACQAVSMGAP